MSHAHTSARGHRLALSILVVGVFACSEAPELRALGARFEPHGAHPDDAIPSLVVQLASVGRAFPVRLGPASVHECAGVVHLRRSETIEEWWQRVGDELEHGVTLAARPPGDGPLALDVAFGVAVERVHDDLAELRDASGGPPIASYAHLVVRDAEGTVLPARFASASGEHLRIEIDDAGARYPLVVDPTLTMHLEAMFSVPGSYRTTSVSMTDDGSRLAAGSFHIFASSIPDGRSALVYARTGTAWALEATLPLPVAGDTGGTQVGYAVGLSGDGARVVVGAEYDDPATGADAGSAHVFSRSGTSWTEEATLAPTGLAAGDRFGASVASSSDGSRVVVGAVTGRAVRVFLRTGTTWAQEALLTQTTLSFGAAVAVTGDGSRLAVACSNTTPTYVYLRTGTSWALEQAISLGGRAVSLSDDGATLVVGTPNEATLAGGSTAGGAHVFTRTGSTWTERSALYASMPGVAQRFGSSLELSNDAMRLLVDAATNNGTHLFLGSGASWTLQDVTPGVTQIDSIAMAGGGTRFVENTSGRLRVYTLDPADPNGTACTRGTLCASGQCVDGVCCDTACGGGATTDCQACTHALTGGAEGTCAPISAGTVCRTTTNMPCDPNDVCDGAATTCPAAAVSPAGTVCRPAAGACDVAELCDGAATTCPGDGHVGAGTVCRGSGGPCDAVEHCDGASAACPADAFSPAGTTCAVAMGPCDAVDTCTGSSSACPSTFVSAGTVCNAVTSGVCDVPDHCSGTDPSCPSEFATGVMCRPSSGLCDLAETCTGTAADCPPDSLTPAGIACRPSSDSSCDPEEQCDGLIAACPSDVTHCGADASIPGVDGGAEDGGSPPLDAASTVDAAPAIDAATPTPAPAAGCACRATSTRGRSPIGPLAIVFGLGLLASRRRLAMLLGAAGLVALVAGAGSTAPRRAGLGADAWVDARGVHARAGRSEVSLRLAAVGRGEALVASTAGAMRSSVDEVRVARSEGLVEWWRVLPSGLEQGMDLEASPRGEGDVVLELETSAATCEHVVETGRDVVVLRSERGEVLARYAELSVLDADGRPVPARLAARGASIRIEITDTGARYPIVVDPMLYVTSEGMLQPTDRVMSDGFGSAVAVSGDGTRAVVGNANHDVGATTDVGDVHVYLRSGTSWTEEATLTPASGGGFGRAVSITTDGTRILVGQSAASQAVVYLRTGTTWAQEAVLTGTTSGDAFGVSVALSPDGTRAIVGGSGTATTTGHATIFLRTGTAWSREATLAPTGGAAGDQFGSSVAITTDGSRVAVGAPSANLGGTDWGAVEVFVRSTTTWTSEARFTTRSGRTGARFGADVSIAGDGSRLVAGEPSDDLFGTAAGTARVYVRSGAAWTQEGVLVGPDALSNGRAVSMRADGGLVVIGAASDIPSPVHIGVAFAFLRSGSVWSYETALVEPGGREGDNFATDVAVSADGSHAIFGAIGRDSATVIDAGAAWVQALAPTSAPGASCTVAAECASGYCVDGVCCADACGGGVTSDCRACASSLTGVASGTCAPISAGTVCLAASGACDVDDVCDGTSPVCAPRYVASGTTCRPAVDDCDLAEVCSGGAASCPADAFAPAGLSCRTAVDLCDREESCDGASAACPPDALASAGTTCRPAGSTPCDPSDVCDGTSVLCPARFAPAGTVCDPTTSGACDAPDVCDGSTATCHATFATGVVCRPAMGMCDLAETCAGTSATCPPDVFLSSGTVCRPATGTCDVDEACDGTTAACPFDITGCAQPDAGLDAWVMPDAGSMPDAASTPDASAMDASAVDSGGGAVDAATTPPPPATGCACRAGTEGSGSGPSPGVIAALLLLAYATRRARRAGLVWVALGLGACASVPPSLVAGGLAASFGGGDAHVELPAGELVVALDAIGRDDAMRPASGSTVRRRDGAVEIERSPGVVEWWRDGAGGLEQGVTLARRPPGQGALVLEMRTDARRIVATAPDELEIETRGGGRARYAHLAVLDARARQLVAHMTSGGDRIRLVVDDRDAEYPIVVDPTLTAVLEAQLVAVGVPSTFGQSLDLSSDGSRVIGGAGYDAIHPATARIFTRSGTAWAEEDILRSPLSTDLGFGDRTAISADGTRAVVTSRSADAGATTNAGLAFVFLRTGSFWNFEATLQLTAPAGGDRFGSSVDISADGSRVLVTATSDDTASGIDTGSATVFVRSGTSWALEATLPASGLVAMEGFGSSAALSEDGTRAVVGSPNALTYQGMAHVFVRSGSTWTEETTLRYSASVNAQFGTAVAIAGDGSRIAASAMGDGTMHVYLRSGTTWAQEASLTASDAEQLGNIMSLSSTASVLAVGAERDNTPDGSLAGSVRVWTRTGTTWTYAAPIYEVPSGGAMHYFGRGVGVSGDGVRVAVGGSRTGSIFTFVPSRANGALCDVATQCSSGFCTDGVCCDRACGGTSADCEACTHAQTGLANGTCATLVAGTVCRAAAGACDPEEVCDGTSVACPATAVLAAGTTCRPAAGPCDRAEVCDGSSAACPGDVRAASGFVCRAASSACDVEEHCDGTSNACPADAFAPSGTMCRGLAGPCDVVDACSGTSADCPDVVQAFGTVCNGLISDLCDAPDHCTGLTAECPAQFATAVVCRPSVGSCDTEELCSGTAAGCPPDLVLGSGIACRPSTAACDPAESCDGIEPTCPAEVNACAGNDAGPPVDAGVHHDAGVDGGATEDASASMDATAGNDASSGNDAGTSPPPPAAGCACRAAPSTRGPSLAGVLVVLAALARRRRR